MFKYYDNRKTRRLEQLIDSAKYNSKTLDFALKATKNAFDFITLKKHKKKLLTF